MIMAVCEESAFTEQIRALRERVAQLESEAEERRARRHIESERAFRLMADAAPVMIWMSGLDTLCTFFNECWLSFRGRTLEQELGNGWAQGVHPADLQRCLETYTTAFHERREFRMEYRLMARNGLYSPIVDTGVPRYRIDGVFAGYIGSCAVVQDGRVSPPHFEQPANRLPLTDREKQVLVLIADGKSTKEVAAHLGISYKTADSHRSKIMEKLGIHETASLVRVAIRNNLISA